MILALALGAANDAAAQDLIFVRPPETVFEPELELQVPLDSLLDLVRREPLDAIAHQALGVALLIKKRPDEAERSFRRAITIDSRLAEAWLGLSVVPYSRWRTELRSTSERDGMEAWRKVNAEAAPAMRRALQLDPLVDRRLYWLVTHRFNWTLDRQTPKHLVAWVQGVQYLRQGEYEAAYQAFDEAVKRDPRERDTTVGSDYVDLRAEAAGRAGRMSEAIADTRTILRRLLQRAPPDSLRFSTDSLANEARFLLGALLQRTGKTDEAIPLFQEVLTHDLSFDLAHVRLGDMYEATGRMEEAVTERRRTVETNPGDPSSLLELGMTLGRAGRPEEARDALLTARKANPDDVRALFALGQAYFVLGDEEEARIQLRHFLELAPARLASLRREATQLLAEMQ